jgi:hypothetical protein
VVASTAQWVPLLLHSAGGTGVLLNIDRVAGQLEAMGAEAHVRGLVDSGWFLESHQQLATTCPETISCSAFDKTKLRRAGTCYLPFLCFAQ